MQVKIYSVQEKKGMFRAQKISDLIGNPGDRSNNSEEYIQVWSHVRCQQMTFLEKALPISARQRQTKVCKKKKKNLSNKKRKTLLSKPQELVSSVPKCLQSDVQRGGDATLW